MRHADPVLETLFLPLEGAIPTVGERVLFLRARSGAPLRQLNPASLTCEQTFKPDADTLVQAGYSIDNGERKPPFDTVLVLPPRQRDESRALLARAVSLTKPGGTVVACASNDAGAKSHEGDLSKLMGSVSVLSKNKCRVFWARAGASVDKTLLSEWLALDAPRSILDGRYRSRPGVFAWDRIDLASALLANQLPASLSGTAADLGAGFGYLSIELANRCPNISSIDLFEAEERALTLAKENLGRGREGARPREGQNSNESASPSKQQFSFHWHDVTTGLPRRYDVIVTNPPFHAQGSADRPDIGRRFIAVAAQSLNPGGKLWLVANRHLPYESILDASFGTTRIVAQEQGFKVIEAVKADARR